MFVGHWDQDMLIRDDSGTDDSREGAPVTTIVLREVGARISQNRLLKTAINFYILCKRKLAFLLHIYEWVYTIYIYHIYTVYTITALMYCRRCNMQTESRELTT